MHAEEKLTLLDVNVFLLLLFCMKVCWKCLKRQFMVWVGLFSEFTEAYF